MKKITRIASALLAVWMLLALGACNNSGGGSDPTATPAADEPKLVILDTEYAVEDYAIAVGKDNTELLDKLNSALAELKGDGTLDAIVAKYIDGVENDLKFQVDVAGDAPVLKMGTNAAFPPYEFYDDSDNIIGIDAEVAAAIADKLGMKLVIEDMEFDAVLVAVQTGKIDVGMAGITVTDERRESMSFSDSYATGVQVVIVKPGSPITSVDDLLAEGADYKIGAQMATTGYLYATWNIEEEGLGTVVGYPKGAEAVQALIAGQVDCVIIDNEPAKAFVEFHNSNG